MTDTCTSCTGPLAGHDTIKACGGVFHKSPQCWCCCKCSKALTSGDKFFNLNGRPLCAPCQASGHQHQCAGCKKPIVAGDSGVDFEGSPFHRACLCCARCASPLAGGGAITRARGTNELLCAKCASTAAAASSTCVSCGKLVTDGVLRALQQAWHTKCFVCCVCLKPADTSGGRGDTTSATGDQGHGFMEKDGQVYCQRDYMKTFAPRCKRCRKIIKGKPVSVPEIDQVFHPECFTCYELGCDTNVQREFYMDDGCDEIYCKPHYDANRIMCCVCDMPILTLVVRANIVDVDAKTANTEKEQAKAKIKAEAEAAATKAGVKFSKNEELLPYHRLCYQLHELKRREHNEYRAELALYRKTQKFQLYERDVRQRRDNFEFNVRRSGVRFAAAKAKTDLARRQLAMQERLEQGVLERQVAAVKSILKESVAAQQQKRGHNKTAMIITNLLDEADAGADDISEPAAELSMLDKKDVQHGDLSLLNDLDLADVLLDPTTLGTLSLRERIEMIHETQAQTEDDRRQERTLLDKETTQRLAKKQDAFDLFEKEHDVVLSMELKLQKMATKLEALKKELLYVREVNKEPLLYEEADDERNTCNRDDSAAALKQQLEQDAADRTAQHSSRSKRKWQTAKTRKALADAVTKVNADIARNAADSALVDRRSNEQEKLVKVAKYNLDLAMFIRKGIQAAVDHVPAGGRPDYNARIYYKLEHDGVAFHFEDVAPRVFRSVRQHYGISEKSYRRCVKGARDATLRSVFRVTSGGGGGGGGGRRGTTTKSTTEVMWESADGRVQVICISAAELACLRRILQAYFDHIRRHPHTFLPRFLGCHKLTLPRDCLQHGVRLLVVANALDTKLPLTRKYVVQTSSSSLRVSNHQHALGATVVTTKDAFPFDGDAGGSFTLSSAAAAGVHASLAHDFKFLTTQKIGHVNVLMAVASSSSAVPSAVASSVRVTTETMADTAPLVPNAYNDGRAGSDKTKCARDKVPVHRGVCGGMAAGVDGTGGVCFLSIVDILQAVKGGGGVLELAAQQKQAQHSKSKSSSGDSSGGGPEDRMNAAAHVTRACASAITPLKEYLLTHIK